MSQLLYFAKSQLFWHQKNNANTAVSCQAVEQYKINLREVNQRKAWKTQGAGAAFMGVARHEEDDDIYEEGIFPSDAVFIEPNKIVYTACLHGGTAIYIKDLAASEDRAEGLVLRRNDFRIQDIDYDAPNKRLAISASSYAHSQHLAILELDSARIDFITEGDCLDCNPCFDPNHSDIIYYDSCGFGVDEQGRFCELGLRGICRLNLKTGDVDEIVTTPGFDFLKPQIDHKGNLYFIKRPHDSGKDESVSIKDIVLAPVKITKAIVGWLDFFTRRYAGESLKTTTGRNPAKAKQKSEEELFIEGNLINVQKTLEENQKAGEKYPGIAPKSWELIQMTPDGKQTILKKGILAYALKDDGTIFYSNGKHLIELAPDQTEKLLMEENLVSKIICSLL